ncbi:FAD:protein FMN transferase [Winogradskyella maritima]|uniref:FAD:protein FMN transferase n=1 Tax=Winogradskyella maritima TaxID=1517766 RepID=A0ABV8AGZ7_9FLAO|nr:FAD:protein FMN transferase [Winogradskyella maritima]
MKRLLLAFCVICCLACEDYKKENMSMSGPIFGTGFNIQYYSESDTNYQKQFDSIFAVINNSLSTYIPDSDISKLNRGETVTMDKHFDNVYQASKKIFKETRGIFDPTIGNVVNAWDFGPEENKFVTDSTTIDSLMKYVNFDKVIKLDNRFIKPEGTYFDFNAIAKGYGIDVICDFLESEGVTNYIVDIGGDMRAKGINVEKSKVWTVGIDDPNFDGSQSYSKVINLSNKGMATSGTYRKFKVDENGNRYAHIIDTKTGYPTKTNVLSVSVIAPNAMLADGYATAFQAMGVDSTKDFLKTHDELKVYFIFLIANGELETLSLNGFPE